MLRTFLRLSVVVASTFIGLPDGAALQPECKRPAAKQFRDGETVVITQPRTLACKVTLVDSPVELRADAAGVVANMGTQVLRMTDGRYVTSTGRGEVSVWGADGKFIRNIGGLGQGPGEFAAGGVSLHEGPGGTLYVRDNNRRWSVFSPALEFLRHHSAVTTGYSHQQSVFLDNGTFLTSQWLGGRAASFFSIFDFGQSAPPEAGAAARGGPPGAAVPSGTLPARIATFGDIASGEEMGASYGRPVSYIGGSSFWAGPPSRVGRGYELELWTTSGVKLRTIRREAPWFAKGADTPPPPLPEGSGFGAPPVTQITMVHADRSGLLYVVAAAASGRWKPVPRTDRAAFQANEEAGYDLYFEVLDVNAGVVLASEGPLTRTAALAALPPQMFRGSSQGYRIGETSDDLPFRRIVEVKLVGQ